MISEVKLFMEAFFLAELRAKTLDLQPNLEEAEKAIKQLYDFATEDCINRFDVILPVSAQSEAFYQRYQDVEFSIPRHLFKISHYENKKHKEIYYVYTSIFLSSTRHKNFFRMMDCFLVASIAKHYKVIGKAGMDPDDTSKWVYYYGDKSVKFNAPGKFLGVERYLEPVDDEDKMAKYYRDE